MPESFSYDVFLSHNSRDKVAVRELAARLRSDGLRVWFDEWEISPGDIIGLKIERGLDDSRALVLVMSTNAFSSDWVSLERHAAMFRDPANTERRFVPLRLDDCTPPSALRQFAYVDWRERSEEQYAKLLAACRNFEIATRPDNPTSESPPRIFHVGGTLPPSMPSYVERSADHLLIQELQRDSGFALVWGSRMIGKSSMVARCVSRARLAGRQAIFVDLSGYGVGYKQLLQLIADEICEAIGAKVPVIESERNADAAFMRFLRQCLREPILVALDEVDYLRASGSMSRFFQLLRAVQVEQAFSNTKVFILISSYLSPREFIKGDQSSPFNIGLSLRLPNFDIEQTTQLARLCPTPITVGEIESIYDFTGGHPYLVHGLVQLVSQGQPLADIFATGCNQNGPFATYFYCLRSEVEQSAQRRGAVVRLLNGNKVSTEAESDLLDRGIVVRSVRGIQFNGRLCRHVLTQAFGQSREK
jgi:hypothetical protein